jgi:hypothetical protein
MSNVRKTGVWVVVYDVVCVAVLGFSLYTGLALGFGDSGLIDRVAAPVSFVISLLDVAEYVGLPLAFVVLLVGGIVLLLNKRGGLTVSLSGIYLCYGVEAGLLVSAILLAILTKGVVYNIPVFIVPLVSIYFAVRMNRRLKRVKALSWKK